MRRRLSKKAVSPVIGYILLISFVIVISLITFQWVKTYIPKEALQCPDGVSMFIQNFTYGDCVGGGDTIFNLSLKNNGRFNISGFFIRSSWNPEIIATEDLSFFASDSYRDGGKISFSGEGSMENSLGPGEEISNMEFSLSPGNSLHLPISYIEIVPIRYEEIDNKLRLSSCSNAKIQEVLCPNVVAPEDACIEGSCSGGLLCDLYSGNCVGCEDDDECEEGDCINGACSVCGDGSISGNEDCEGSDLGGEDCVGLGFGGQEPRLACLSDCTFDTSNCLKPDLELTVLSVAIPTTGSNRNVITAEYTITNNGNFIATGVYVDVTTNSTDVANVQSTPAVTVPAEETIPASPSPPESISWTYDSVGSYRPFIEVDMDDVIKESDENNNRDTLSSFFNSIECVEVVGNKIECIKVTLP